MNTFKKPLPLIRNNNTESKLGREKTNLEKMMYYAKLSLVDGYNKKLKENRMYREIQFLRKRVEILERENECLKELQHKRIQEYSDDEELCSMLKEECKQ